MIKRTYQVDYVVRPNKRTEGRAFTRKMSTTGVLGKGNNTDRMVAVLAVIHRVNVNAIEIDGWEEVGKKVELNLFSRLARWFGRTVGRAA